MLEEWLVLLETYYTFIFVNIELVLAMATITLIALLMNVMMVTGIGLFDDTLTYAVVKPLAMGRAIISHPILGNITDLHVLSGSRSCVDTDEYCPNCVKCETLEKLKANYKGCHFVTSCDEEGQVESLMDHLSSIGVRKETIFKDARLTSGFGDKSSKSICEKYRINIPSIELANCNTNLLDEFLIAKNRSGISKQLLKMGLNGSSDMALSRLGLNKSIFENEFEQFKARRVENWSNSIKENSNRLNYKNMLDSIAKVVRQSSNPNFDASEPYNYITSDILVIGQEYISGIGVVKSDCYLSIISPQGNPTISYGLHGKFCLERIPVAGTHYSPISRTGYMSYSSNTRSSIPNPPGIEDKLNHASIITCENMLINGDSENYRIKCSNITSSLVTSQVIGVDGKNYQIPNINIYEVQSYKNIYQYDCTSPTINVNEIYEVAKGGTCAGDQRYCQNFKCESTSDCFCNIRELNGFEAVNVNGIKRKSDGDHIKIDDLFHGPKLLHLPNDKEYLYNKFNCSQVSLSMDKNVMRIVSNGDSIRQYKISKDFGTLSGVMVNITMDVKIRLPDEMVMSSGFADVFIWLKNTIEPCDGKFDIKRVDVCSRFTSDFELRKWSNWECYNGWQVFLVVVLILLIIPLMYPVGKLIWYLGTWIYWLVWVKIIKRMWRYIRTRKYKSVIRSIKNKLSRSDIDDTERQLLNNKLDIIQSNLQHYRSLNERVMSKENARLSMFSKQKFNDYNPSIIPGGKKNIFRKQGISLHGPYKSTTSPLMTTIIFSFMFFGISDSCSVTQTMVVDQSRCKIMENGLQECVVTQSALLSLSPIGQDSCFTMTDKSGGNIGTFIVTVHSQSIRCNKYSLYFSPSKIDVVSGMYGRCSGSSWCGSGSEYCLNQAKSLLEEGKLPLRLPNNAILSYGCNLVASHGDCFTGGRNCAYYYYGSVNPTRSVSEVFGCTDWTLSVDVSMKAIYNQPGMVPESKRMRLTVGELGLFEGISVGIVSSFVPPSSIIDKCFIKDEVKEDKSYRGMLMIDACNKRGEYTNQKVGTVQCDDIRGASYVDPSRCITSTDYLFMELTADSIKVSERFVNPSSFLLTNSLPTKLGNFLVEDKDGLPEAKITTNSLIQLQMNMKDFRINSITNENKCYAEFVSLKGCYSCTIGALLILTVNTNFGDAVATIRCPSIAWQTVAKIEEKKKDIEIVMHISRDIIDTVCSIECPAGNSNFRIRGELEYMNNVNHNSNSTLDGVVVNPGGIGIGSLWSMSWFRNIIFIGIAVGIIILILYFIKKILHKKKRNNSNKDQ